MTEVLLTAQLATDASATGPSILDVLNLDTGRALGELPLPAPGTSGLLQLGALQRTPASWTLQPQPAPIDMDLAALATAAGVKSTEEQRVTCQNSRYRFEQLDTALRRYSATELLLARSLGVVVLTKPPHVAARWCARRRRRRRHSAVEGKAALLARLGHHRRRHGLLGAPAAGPALLNRAGTHRSDVITHSAYSAGSPSLSDRNTVRRTVPHQPQAAERKAPESPSRIIRRRMRGLSIVRRANVSY